MDGKPRNKLDPFRTVIGLINNSDTLISTALAAGLQFDINLTEGEDYSHNPYQGGAAANFTKL